MDEDHEKWLARCLRLVWREENARPGVAPAALDELEARCGRPLPSDFKRCWLEADGMHESHCDQRLIRFWPVSEMRIVPPEDPGWSELGISFLAFADFCLESHLYVLTLCADLTVHRVLLLGGPEPLAVGACFSDFLLDFYLQGKVFPATMAPPRPLEPGTELPDAV